jgi:hypothetical protein
MAGLVAGTMVTTTGCSKEDTGTTAPGGTNSAATDKHDCAGKNSCKGKGGCKTSDAGCAGKNSCKGKGGCKVA